ncbi:TPA: arginine--tRNA ligase, partial [Patescibacteria group bacterium]|nr:arginine--tRNA ligase [Patescibacteria group bacterium]
TYEGKDMGLAPLQFNKYHPDLIIHIVGPEQAEYFKVVFEALYQLNPQMKNKQFHLIYGWVKLKHGKMSSRSGNVVLGEWLIDTAKTEIYNILQNSKSNYSKEDQELISEKCAIAAVKYSFLRVSTQQEISFDIDASVNFEGDSGPYLLYSYARAKSVLRKATQQTVISDQKTALDLVSTLKHIDLKNISLTTEEREILRRLMYFPEIVNEAAGGYTPSLICNYLFELAQSFNLFYAKHSILGTAHDNKINEQTRQFRVALTSATAQVFKKGLYLLGVDVLEKM